MIMSSEEFLELCLSMEPTLYHRAAHDSASEEVWLDIIQKHPEMRENVAHNKTVRGKILEILAEDKDWRVRRQVAERRAAGEKLLMKLAFDSEGVIKSTIIDNPKVTKNILMLLLGDKEKYIQIAAAEKLANWKD